MPIPSTSLLRSFLKPNTIRCISCQTRSMSKFPNFMPREKYAKVNRLDKLHREQKKALIQERLETHERALALEASMKAEPNRLPISDLPFHIARTKMQNFPIYETSKGGGSKKITTIRLITGDVHACQSQILAILNLPKSITDPQGRKKEPVKVNNLTKHIIISGWRAAEIKKWAEVLGF